MRKAIVALMVLAGCGTAAGRDRTQSEADLLHSAVHRLSSIIVYDIMSPPQSSRVYAYASIAAYETLRPAHPEYHTLAGQLAELTPPPLPDPNGEYSLPLASAHAFLTVGRAMVFSRARVDTARVALERQVQSGLSREVFDRSIAYGDSVAAHILRWAAKDHYLQTRGYPKYSVTSSGAGRWVPTPPAYMDAVEPNWNRIRPFAMDSASQFRPIAPPAFDTTKGSPFYAQAKEVLDVSGSLTDEQRAIAAFWDCNPYVMHVQGHAMYATKKISPGGHWMGIIAIASRKANADIMRSAEAYARSSIALADAFISTWDEKYRSAVLRPETVINQYIDERWEPLLQTPPFPEYPSGHSVISTAAATVLADQFGSPFAFADSSEMEFGLPVRSFPSFEAAAAEAAMSRLYGGIHYRGAIEQGVAQGRKVGALVIQRVRTRGDVVTLAGGSRPAPAAGLRSQPGH